MKEFQQMAADKVFSGHRPTVLGIVPGRCNVNNGAVMDNRPAVKLIAAGPLTAQPGSMTSRVVLIVTDTGGQFGLGQLIVYDEVFSMYREAGDTESSYYSSGKYFSLSEMKEATAYFANRIASRAEDMLSVYRVEEIIK